MQIKKVVPFGILVLNPYQMASSRGPFAALIAVSAITPIHPIPIQEKLNPDRLPPAANPPSPRPPSDCQCWFTPVMGGTL